MDFAIVCPCGHALDHHEATGCVGDRKRACSRREDPHEALLAAIAAGGGAELQRRSRSVARPTASKMQDLADEFDLYWTRNGIEPNDAEQAFLAFIREYGEAPDVSMERVDQPKGESLCATAVAFAGGETHRQWHHCDSARELAATR